MTTSDLAKHVDSFFKKRIRLIAESSTGFSSSWMFWPNGNDFYFGSKSILGALKISFHANGRGYVGYDKKYLHSKWSAGIEIPDKTVHEWELPKPGPLGAVNAAIVKLPADYFIGAKPGASSLKKTIVLGVEQGCAAEIGVFLSQESLQTLEPKLMAIGTPMVMMTLDNNSNVSIVLRSETFDPSVLPTTAMFAESKALVLQKEPLQEQGGLNAMFWNSPKDGETLQVIDVGGLAIKKK